MGSVEIGNRGFVRKPSILRVKKKCIDKRQDK